MHDFLNVTLLAVLQGVAEFLPVSSSGHLVILQHLLEVPDALRLRLEVVLHAGTLLSIFVFYRQRLLALFGGLCRRNEEGMEARRYAVRIVVSAIPAVIVYFLFHHDIDALVSNARMVGALLMFTGAVLVGTRYLSQGACGVTLLRALWMGIGQAIALLPGVSRSGMTLASARAGRVAPASAAEFSFLMSAPLILGGVLLELVKGEAAAPNLSWGLIVWGLALSAVVGYASLALLLKTLRGRGFWLFGPYCLLAGLATVIFCG